MYVEGLADLNELIMYHDFKPANEKEENLANILDKAANRYLPVFEKVRNKDLVALLFSNIVFLKYQSWSTQSYIQKKRKEKLNVNALVVVGVG